MKIDFSKDPELVAMNKKQEEEGMKELNGILDELIGSGKMGKGAMPPEKDLNKLEKGTYKTNFEVPGYQILAKSPTVTFYKRIVDNTIVIAVRGSADKRDWLQTNTMLPFGRLTTTSRYKEDKKFVADNLAKFAEGNDIYIVGHSLGGAIANQLQIDFPIIQGGITFNPAFQPMDFLNKSKVQRKYTSGDPLGKLGRYLPGSVVEDDSSLLDRFLPSVGLMGKSHRLDSFQSGQEGGISAAHYHRHRHLASENANRNKATRVLANASGKVVMDKKAYVKEHKKLIKLLEKAGKEGEEQKKELAKELKKGGNLTDEQINKYKFDAKKELDEWIHDKQQKMKKQGVPTIDILKQYNSSDLEEVDELIHKIENKLELAFKKGYDMKVKDLVLKQDRNEDEKVKLIIRLLLNNNNKKLNSDLTNKVRDLGNELGVNLNASSSGIMANLIKIPEYNVEVADFESFTPSEHQKPIVIALGKSNDGDLHAIIIKKKGYNKNDAVVEAAKFKTSKGLFMRETKLSYRFRNIPKTKFDPKSFRTKKINKNISLVYGKLK
jgi:hypothetical protein